MTNKHRKEFETKLLKHMPHANLEFDGEGYTSAWVQAAWTGYRLAERPPSGTVVVPAGALQMVINALRRDAAEGKFVRGEMADELLMIQSSSK